MLRLARRTVAVTVAAGLAVTLPAVRAGADPVHVTLTPASGSVGDTVSLTAPSGLANVEAVTFGSAAPASVLSASDTEVDVVVPADATSGAVVLGYGDGSPDATTDATFAVVPLPTAGTIARSTRVVTFTESVRFRGTLSAAGAPVPGQRARLQRAPRGTDAWDTIGSARTTDGNGAVRWTRTPRATADYRIVFHASPQYAAATTSRVRVAVRALVRLHVPSVAPIYTRTSLTGRVRPAPGHRVRVTLARRVDGAWHRVERRRTAGDGRFTFHVEFPATGRYAYRVHRPHDATHLAGTSAVGVVTAVKRTLRSGDSGPDVVALQKRLRRLHYDVGRVDGHYGYDTLHAVVAFQKVQGIERDGVVDPRDWRRLADPRRPHLRHPGAAADAGVEVDLTKQVVYYAVDGRIRKVIDASTGGGYTYTGSDGTTQRAITPTGHYQFLYRYDDADHWQHAPLGELYKPVYFRSDGYAIHGATSVPSYPASHGCVRITVPAMDRFNARFAIGMSVWVYRS